MELNTMTITGRKWIIQDLDRSLFMIATRDNKGFHNRHTTTPMWTRDPFNATRYRTMHEALSVIDEWFDDADVSNICVWDINDFAETE